jgi:S-adenosylmethionine:tRNA ribosyltransferase-isomerase
MENLQLSDFNFELDEKSIAQVFNPDNLNHKMLEVNLLQINNLKFKDFIDLIDEKDLLIFNNTKVIKTRLLGFKNTAKILITLHKQINHTQWLSFIKNSKRLKANDIIEISKSFKVKVLEKKDSGEVLLELIILNNAYNNIFECLEKYGFMPLPPYIKRSYNEENISNKNDSKDYQSIFAKKEGAVASPTASLHFDDNIISQLKNKGVKIAFTTLHVGAGTFLPVKVENIKDHIIHTEYGELPQETITAIENCKKNGGRVVAIGTTTLRVLEYVYHKNNQLVPFAGEIDIFIYPPFNFKVVDILFTNFHLPKSTLFMLVCAFAGIKEMKNAYEYAKINQYKFFSYGDCCFLHKKTQ